MISGQKGYRWLTLLLNSRLTIYFSYHWCQKYKEQTAAKNFIYNWEIYQIYFKIHVQQLCLEIRRNLE